MSDSEKIKELQDLVDNLLVQNALSIAKEGAMLQMVLGVYRETHEKKAYNSIVSRFIDLWEQFSLNALSGIEVGVYDPSIIDRQKKEVVSNVKSLRKTFLD